MLHVEYISGLKVSSDQAPHPASSTPPCAARFRCIRLQFHIKFRCVQQLLPPHRHWLIPLSWTTSTGRCEEPSPGAHRHSDETRPRGRLGSMLNSITCTRSEKDASHRASAASTSCTHLQKSGTSRCLTTLDIIPHACPGTGFEIQLARLSASTMHCWMDNTHGPVMYYFPP